MQNYYKHYRLNELIILSLNSLFKSILKILKFNDKILPFKLDIDYFLSKELKIKRENYNVIISDHKTFHNQKYLLRLNSSDRLVFDQVIIKNEYKPIVDIINCETTNNSIKTIIDAGSNIGLTTLFFNYYFPDAKIISIEPDVSNYTQLLKNIQLNNLNRCIIPLNRALWSNNTDLLTTSSKFRDGGFWATTVCLSNIQYKSIKSITLNDVINNFMNYPTIDILKMDIEGTEAVLFRSQHFIDILVRYVRFLCFEIHEEFMKKEELYKILIESCMEFSNIGETTFCINKNLLKSKFNSYN